METTASITHTVVHKHLQAFLEQRGIDAIVADYADDACFLAESGTYRGRCEISGFFARFMASLPAQAIENFALRHLSVEGDVALIVWSVGQDLPLGTDTFVVRSGKIARQTFAMHAAPVAQSGQALSHLLRGS